MADEVEVAQDTQTEAPGAAGKSRIGVVVSDRMNKTCVVEVQRLKKHPLYKKYIRRDKKLYVHDEANDARIGDRVEVAEISRPLSKLKRYTLVRIVERAK